MTEQERLVSVLKLVIDRLDNLACVVRAMEDQIPESQQNEAVRDALNSIQGDLEQTTYKMLEG